MGLELLFDDGAPSLSRRNFVLAAFGGIADLIDDIGYGKPDDDGTGDENAREEDGAHRTPEELEQRPGDAGADIAPACGQLGGGEHRRARIALRREKREQGEQRDDHERKPRADAQREIALVRADEQACADRAEQERQQERSDKGRDP